MCNSLSDTLAIGASESASLTCNLLSASFLHLRGKSIPTLCVDATCMPALNNKGQHGAGDGIAILTILVLFSSSGSYGSSQWHVGGGRHRSLRDYRGARGIDYHAVVISCSMQRGEVTVRASWGIRGMPRGLPVDAERCATHPCWRPAQCIPLRRLRGHAIRTHAQSNDAFQPFVFLSRRLSFQQQHCQQHSKSEYA